jgi:hypothetical protein
LIVAGPFLDGGEIRVPVSAIRFYNVVGGVGSHRPACRRIISEWKVISDKRIPVRLSLHKHIFVQLSPDFQAISRLYRGIHYREAIEAGLTQGRKIGANISALPFRN